MNEAIEALKRQLKIDVERNCTDPGSTHYESCPCSQLRELEELERLAEIGRRVEEMKLGEELMHWKRGDWRYFRLDVPDIEYIEYIGATALDALRKQREAE